MRAVVTAPVTIAYSRFSLHRAHRFAARALAELLAMSHLDKKAVDGLCFASWAEAFLVAGARVGVVSGFGMINYDRGLCCGAAILAREA
jgi:hypothetical protein